MTDAGALRMISRKAVSYIGCVKKMVTQMRRAVSQQIIDRFNRVLCGSLLETSEQCFDKRFM